jgi:phospholipid transport system substrate-binding protein
VLGRYINVVTPDQHSQYLTLFHQLLAYNITYQIKAYQGVTFVVNSASVMGNDTVVDTTITRPGQAPADVGWAVDEVDGSPKIVDVIVAGTSLRITERNDYASVVTSNGGQISALLSAMQNQIDRIKSNQ